jgi:UDP-glucose 4-epimerase
MELVYITGYSGFVGTRLSKKVEKFSPLPHDLIDTTKLDTFDKFYFLSTYGNMYDHTEPHKITKANVSDLITVLNQVDFDKGFKSFVFVSTSSVKLKRQTMYSRTKKAAEEILLAYAEKYNAPICIIRPYSVTGVGEQTSHLIPRLIDSCLNGTKIDFVEDPVHDFIDVEDVVDGILNLSEHSAKGVFELGSGIGHTNKEVREIVEKVTGKSANVNIVTRMRDYDSDDWVSTNFRARSYGWLPKKTLEQSIQEMVEAYKSYQEGGV